MSERSPTRCPLCDAEPRRISQVAEFDVVLIECPRCGPVKVTGLVLVTECLKPEITPYLSAYTRECADTGQEPEILDLSNVHEMIQRYANTSAAEKLDKLLRLVGDISDFHGAQAPFSPEWDYPVIHAKNREEAIFHLSELERQDYIEVVSEDSVVITHKGWERLERTSLRADDRETDTKKWDVLSVTLAKTRNKWLNPWLKLSRQEV